MGIRHLVIVGAMSAGALGLAIPAASAATTWGGPQPTPTYTQPSEAPQPVCEYSLLTEHDTVTDVPGADQQQYGDNGGNAWAEGAPSSAPQTYGGYGDHHTDSVLVEQVVRFCVTEGRHGHPDTVKVWDVTGPFAWVDEGYMAPTPSGYNSALAPFLSK